MSALLLSSIRFMIDFRKYKKIRRTFRSNRDVSPEGKADGLHLQVKVRPPFDWTWDLTKREEFNI